MNLSPHFKASLGLIALWIPVVLWIAPWGNFPLNDDWTYARQVFDFLENGTLKSSSWAAMPFLPQSLLGIALTKLAGFSFLTLRMMSLLIAVVNSLLLFRLLMRIQDKVSTAFIFTLLFAFNPIALYLSMTYMTEVYALFLLLLSLTLMERYLRIASVWTLGWIVLCAIGLVLQRQTDIILPFAFMLVIWLRKNATLRDKIKAALPFALGVLALSMYGFWRSQTDSVPGHYARFTDLFASLFDFRIAFFLERAGVILLYLALFIFPLLVFLPFRAFKFSRLASLLLLLTCLPLAFAFHTFPRNQVLFNFGIGPRLLKDTILHAQPFFPPLAYALVAGFACAVLLILIYAYFQRKTLSFQEMWSKFRTPEFGSHAVLRLAALGYAIYLLLNLIFFDRYLLPLLLLLLLILASHLPTSGRLRQGLYFGITFVLLVLSTSLLRDHFRWQEVRWLAIEAAEKMGHGADELDGGFEYNCWKNGAPIQEPHYDLHARGWWRVVDDTWVISEDRIEGFIPVRYFPYDPLVGPLDSLVLSKRDDANTK